MVRALVLSLACAGLVLSASVQSQPSRRSIVQQTDQKLAGAGWQRITRIKDESSTMSVLTHTVGDRVNGLVVLIFDRDDKQLVFANLAGEIDITRLGEIGERFNVPGLNSVPLGD